MLAYEGTLVITLRLPIELDADDRHDAQRQMLERLAEARAAGAVASAHVEGLVAILARADRANAIPVRKVATETEEVCEDSIRMLRRPLDNPVWHCFEARGARHVGSGEDPHELWLAASGRDVASFRATLPDAWRGPAWTAAVDHARGQAAARIAGPNAPARRNEFLRGTRYALEFRGPPPCYQYLWTDAYYGFRWALKRMEELDTPEHQRLVQLEVAGEIPIARVRGCETATVYVLGGPDCVPAGVTHILLRCLWEATHRMDGAAQRWRLRATLRQSDDQLLRALAGEFGPATYGYSGSHGSWQTGPGPGPSQPDPTFHQGILDSGRKLTGTEWRHTLRGPDLVRHARALLSIPDPDGRIPSVELWEEALDDLMLLTPRRRRNGTGSPREGAVQQPDSTAAESASPLLPLFA